MSDETCSDDRFELIAKAKTKLLESTNIESRPEEVAVLDSILFRCWQMGWFDHLRDGAATLGSGTKGCENLLWELVGALDVADATDASKKPIVAEYARRIAATLGSGTCPFARPTDLTDGCAALERIGELEELVKQLWHLVNHRSGYGYATALEAIEELGIEVGDDER